jgi:hypothetical protein
MGERGQAGVVRGQQQANATLAHVIGVFMATTSTSREDHK